MTKELERNFPNIFENDTARIFAKYFHPWSNYRFYAMEYDPEIKRFFGYVTGVGFPELGYVTLKEMEELKINGCPMERDLHWDSRTTLSQVKSGEVI